MKKILKFGLVLFAILFIPSMASAAVFKSNENVAAGQTINQNLYMAGGNPIMAGNVYGDLYIAGGTINITGSIEGDLVVAGGNVTVTGNVGQDVRAFGGSVLLDGKIGGEVLSFGGQVTLGPNTVIQKDLIAGGDEIKIDPSAKVNGETKVFKGEEKKEMLTNERVTKFLTAAFWGAIIFGLIAYLILAAILLGVFPNVIRKFTDLATVNGTAFWKYLGLGFAFLIGAPICAVLLFVTGVGALVGGLILVVYVFMILINLVAAGILFGTLAKQLITNDRKAQPDWLWGLGGIVVLHLISQIPVIGWIIGFVFFLYSMGASLAKDWMVYRAVK